MVQATYAVLPETGTHKLAEWHSELRDAVANGGGSLTDVSEANALIWTSNNEPHRLMEVLGDNPQIQWIQLPSAGVERWLDFLDNDRTWTSAKGAYAEPVAEHALSLTLGGLRGVAHYARMNEWTPPFGTNLFDANICILGGGEITRCLLELLEPFRAEVTVVRNRVAPIPKARRVVGSDRLHEALSNSDAVILALALTPETEGMIDAAALEAMSNSAWLVNVARGKHVKTDDLVIALQNGDIAGAALDVTDPEPLPAGHPLWDLPNVVITPHLGNTPEMGFRYLTKRITENVARYNSGREVIGKVNIDLGY